nr:YgjP-like metallopeptidase domain-containing protein [Halomicrobium sp. LC1Hm]
MSTRGGSLTLPSGDQIDYTVSERDIQHPRLEIAPDGTVRIIVPPGQSGPPLINEETGWIRSELEDQRQRRRDIQHRYGNVEEAFTLWGKSYTLDIQSGSKRIDVDSERVSVRAPGAQAAMGLLHESLRQALREAVKTIASPFCDRLQVSYETLAIRSQRTKWASCSGGDTLNFNIRCAFLPFAHLRYLVAHEVAHLLEATHNERFWKLVRTMVPDAKSRRDDLQGFWYALHHNPHWQKILDV